MSKNVIITGVGPGIGSSLTTYLGSRGYNISLSSMGDSVKNMAEKLNCDYYQCNLKNINEANEMVRAFVEKYKTIDAIINVAGNYFSMEKIEDFSPADFDSTLLNNAKTFYNISKAVVPHLKKQKYGNIIGFSAAENVYLNGSIGYSAGKGAVYFMVKSLARELLDYNIKVNGIAPGFIDKSKHEYQNEPLLYKGRYSSEDINKTVEFLINNNMVTGEIIRVAGGHNIKIDSGI